MDFFLGLLSAVDTWEVGWGKRREGVKSGKDVADRLSFTSNETWSLFVL